MRFIYCLAVSWLVLFGEPSLAQNQRSAAGSTQSGAPDRNWPGPIIDGRRRQPTQAEVDARQKAAGRSQKSIEEQGRRLDQEIDDIYKALTTPDKPSN